MQAELPYNARYMDFHKPIYASEVACSLIKALGNDPSLMFVSAFANFTTDNNVASEVLLVGRDLSTDQRKIDYVVIAADGSRQHGGESKRFIIHGGVNDEVIDQVRRELSGQASSQ